MTPTAQRSARRSMLGARLTCSGDMYAGEPIMLLTAVRFCFTGPPVDLEMPKSSTLTRRPPSARLARKRLEGLRSRWMTPMRCAMPIPVSAWMT